MIDVLIFIILLIIAAVIVVKLTFAVLKWMAMNAIVGLILVGVLNYLGVTHIELNLINFLNSRGRNFGRFSFGFSVLPLAFSKSL